MRSQNARDMLGDGSPKRPRIAHTMCALAWLDTEAISGPRLFGAPFMVAAVIQVWQQFVYCVYSWIGDRSTSDLRQREIRHTGCFSELLPGAFVPLEARGNVGDIDHGD